MPGRTPASLAVAVLCVGGLVFGGCDLLDRPQPRADGATSATTEDWRRSVDSLVEALFEAQPHSAVALGRHDYDGRLADYSDQGLRQWVEVLRALRQEAVAFDADLSPEQELERSHLLTRIDRELFVLETAALSRHSALYYLEGLDPVVYVAREYAPAVERLRAYVRYAQNLPEAASQISRNLEAPLARVQLEVAATTFEALSAFLARDVAHAFSGVGDPALQASFVRVNEAARAALRDLSERLRSRIPSAPEGGFALGRDALAEMLWKSERLSVGLEELSQAAEQEIASAMAALTKVCEPSDAPEEAMRECARELRQPLPGWSARAAANRQVETLRQGLGRSGTVAIAPGAAVLIRDTLPYRGHVAARLETPGAFDIGLDAVYRVAEPPIPVDRGASVFPSEADLWLLSAREVLPGKLALYLYGRKEPSEVQRLSSSRGSLQGWAHYAEQLAFEEGMLPDTPASEVAYRLSSILHAVRLLAVLGLHAEGSTLAETEELFRSRALLSDKRARAEAVWAAVDPGRLLDAVGRLLILRLREDWFFEQGETATLAAFHHRLLSFGGAPLMTVRAEMVGDTGGSPL